MSKYSHLYPNSKIYSFEELRLLAANHMRQNREDYLPFLDINSDIEFEEYCNNVESVAKAVWGGQIEVKALSKCLGMDIYIYDSEAPLLKMSPNDSIDSHNTNIPLRLTYHRHYYALGEHYNSVENVKAP